MKSILGFVGKLILSAILVGTLFTIPAPCSAMQIVIDAQINYKADTKQGEYVGENKEVHMPVKDENAISLFDFFK